MQINLEVPEVVLGPNVIACMGRMIARTSLCQGPHLLTQALRLLLLRHHTHNPAAAVSAAVRAGDWAGAEERLRELPRAAQANLAAEANDLAACDDATGGADAKRRGKGKRKCAPVNVALPSPGAGTQRDAVLCCACAERGRRRFKWRCPFADPSTTDLVLQRCRAVPERADQALYLFACLCVVCMHAS